MLRDDLTWEDLGVAEPISRRLLDNDFAHPFQIQALVIPDAIAGNDILGKAKTGSGKTLGFGIPLVQRMKEGVSGTQGLILVPTRELCSQVAKDLRMLCSENARVLDVYGGSSMQRDLKEAKGAHIIVATPGRLIDLLERKAADLSNIRVLVIDEADRMADMGFLPQVGKILEYVPSDRQTMLFSATLDHAIQGLIAQTKDPVRHEATDEMPTVEGVEHHFFLVHHMDKREVLKAILESPRELTLVFTRTKRGCDKLARDLQKDGVKATAIHGDLDQRAREKALDRFGSGDVDVLVATEVAARGLDIDDITQVVNYDPPEDFKAYVHRVGRTARAGAKGVGVTLVFHDQKVMVERISRALRLDADIEEIYSSDPMLRKLGTGAVAGAQPIEVDEEAPAMAGAYGRFKRSRRR